MKEEKIKRIIHTITRFKYIIYIFFVCTGILLCALGWEDNQILIGLGTNLISSCLISIIILFCFSELENTKKRLEKWGIEEIYSERNIKLYNDTFPKHNLDFIAFGLSHFIKENYDLNIICHKIKKGLSIRIITLHPDSFFADEQGLFENQNVDISKQIRNLDQWVNSIKDRLDDNYKDRIDIKYYDNLPLFFYCRADDVVYTGPYLPNKPSQNVVTYEYNTIKKGGYFFVEYFERLWNQVDMPIVFIPYEEKIFRIKVKNSIINILNYFAKLMEGEEEDRGSVIGIVVIFKGDYRRTFYSSKKTEEKHLCYKKNKGAFGEFFSYNNPWVTNERFTMLFKDYKNKNVIIQKCLERKKDEIYHCAFTDDREKMNSSIDAVLITPLIKDETIIGAVTFDFVGFNNEYNKIELPLIDSEKGQIPIKNKIIVQKWFEYAKICTRMLRDLIGNQAETDYSDLFYESWVE